MTISILVPVYNVADYLPQCLDSILANDLTDCEVVLVDDGSTDASGAICDEYAARHPDLIRVIHQPNGGIGAARNASLDAARGDWLLFVDSDDRLVPTAVATLKGAIAAHPGVDVVGFQFFADDGVNPPVPQSSGIAAAPDPFPLAQRGDCLLALPSVWIRLWRRSLYGEGEIRFAQGVWYEDIRVTAKLLALARGILILPDHLYLYLTRQGSIMNNSKLDRNREILDAMEDILSWYRRTGRFADFETELEALTVQHVLLAASVRVARQDPRHPLLKEFYAYTQRNFPQWRKNPYNRKLPRAKRLALALVGRRQYRLVQLLFKLKG